MGAFPPELGRDHWHVDTEIHRESVVIEVRMRHEEREERWIRLFEPSDFGERYLVIPTGRKRPAEIEDDSATVVRL